MAKRFAHLGVALFGPRPSQTFTFLYYNFGPHLLIKAKLVRGAPFYTYPALPHRYKPTT